MHSFGSGLKSGGLDTLKSSAGSETTCYLINLREPSGFCQLGPMAKSAISRKPRVQVLLHDIAIMIKTMQLGGLRSPPIAKSFKFLL